MNPQDLLMQAAGIHEASGMIKELEDEIRKAKA